ncbi:MAG: hypothetical protein KDK36_13000 [Leptospiraceae bacterium]|nr:hypothetical protein [Leptospiraceae bacterium]
MEVAVKPKITIIIPLLPKEENKEKIEQHLKQILPEKVDFILSCPDPPGNRAYALNKGAEKASGEFLWFLHSDSILDSSHVLYLLDSIEKYPERMHYFLLEFFPSSLRMKFNSIGANLRSKILGCPYGDQGLCVKKDIFHSIGGYPEDQKYGEDHVFVWRARQRGIKLNMIPLYLQTSDRKYRLNGWFKITLLHQFLFWKQMLPELKEYIFKRKIT